MREIETGLFVRNNEERINKEGATLLMTSLLTMQKIMGKYSKAGANGYITDIDTFVNKVEPGETTLVWVNGNHYIK